MPSTVLVVDDKEMMRDSVGSTLSRAGFQVLTAEHGQAALGVIASRRPDAIITDLNMPGMTGMELLERVHQIDDELPVVLMTAYGTIQTAVEAMKLGAFDYITKPFEGDELIIAVKRAIRHAGLVRENQVLRLGQAGAPEGRAGGASGLERLIGDSPVMREVKEQVRAVAASHGTVLVTGESGAGKEVVARAIHDLSPRAGAPFLAVNCAALSESLLESELFGHEKGAFTGADKLRKGRFELADGGTLLLDEVSEISPQLQAKLLRVLQERAFERVGSSLTIGVDVRVIATSNRDLPAAAAAGTFRQDLFYRLNVLPLRLPPLRERPGDVPGLARHFAALIGAREGRPPAAFRDDAMALLTSYRWPGNVRELANICERASVLSATGPEAGVVTRRLIEPWLLGSGQSGLVRQKAIPLSAVQTNGASHATSHLGGADTGNGHQHRATPAPAVLENSMIAELKYTPGDTKLSEIERETIVATLKRFNGHRQKTAKALGIGVRTLGLKLKKWKEEALVAPNL